MNFFHRFILAVVSIIVFYYYIKLGILFISSKLSYFLQLTKSYSLETAKGIVELPLIVFFHFGFIMFLWWLEAGSIFHQTFNFHQIKIAIPLGIFLGIGMMGFSSLLSRAVIECLRHIPKPYFPFEVKDWLIMTRSGWLRHYLYVVDKLPLSLALLIVFGQVWCEEMMFRNILIHYFLPEGPVLCVVVSTSLFMFMQIFHMPNLLSLIFPLIGAMVIGLTNAILYLKFFDLFPLVIAHFTFFIVAVL